MSGFIRNLLTVLYALFMRGRSRVQSTVICFFWITPFDCGTRVLKSDKYLQLAEAAQLDFLIKTKLIGKLLNSGTSFVNAAQQIKFIKPIGMFRRLKVETAIICIDERCAYFSHTFILHDQRHAEIWVKMKFKQKSRTVAPSEIAGLTVSPKPRYLQLWDETLETIA